MKTPSSDTTPLSPCPFCGCDEEGLSIDGNRISANIYCNGCEASGPAAEIKYIQMSLITPADTAAMMERARLAWNKRAAP